MASVCWKMLFHQFYCLDQTNKYISENNSFIFHCKVLISPDIGVAIVHKHSIFFPLKGFSNWNICGVNRAESFQGDEQSSLRTKCPWFWVIGWFSNRVIFMFFIQMLWEKEKSKSKQQNKNNHKNSILCVCACVCIAVLISGLSPDNAVVKSVGKANQMTKVWILVCGVTPFS